MGALSFPRFLRRVRICCRFLRSILRHLFGYPPCCCISACDRQSKFARLDHSDESTCPLWSGTAGVPCSVPAGYGCPPFAKVVPQPASQSANHDERSNGYRKSTPSGVGFIISSSPEYHESPRFWSPFGNVGKAATQGASSYDGWRKYHLWLSALDLFIYFVRRKNELRVLNRKQTSAHRSLVQQLAASAKRIHHKSIVNTVDYSVSTRATAVLPATTLPSNPIQYNFQSYLRNADGELEDTDAPCVIPFPSTFRLERTNFVAIPPSPGETLPVESLLDALRSALSGAGVDVLEFKPAHCVVSRWLRALAKKIQHVRCLQCSRSFTWGKAQGRCRCQIAAVAQVATSSMTTSLPHPCAKSNYFRPTVVHVFPGQAPFCVHFSRFARQISRPLLPRLIVPFPHHHRCPSYAYVCHDKSSQTASAGVFLPRGQLFSQPVRQSFPGARPRVWRAHRHRNRRR